MDAICRLFVFGFGAVGIAGCGSDSHSPVQDARVADPDAATVDAMTPPQEYHLSPPPPPENLMYLAEQIRAAGGVVFVGTVGPTMNTSPARAEVMTGVWVEYPQYRAEITVEDDLGAMTADLVTAVTSSGEAPTLTDEFGDPADDWVVIGTWDPGPHRLLQPEGRAVWFVAGTNLVWRTDLVASTVSGEGTTDGADVSLEMLRL